MKILFLIPLLFLMSCEDEEQNTVLKAQECLNKATASTVADCRTILEGIETRSSYVIRCGIDFLEKGMTATNLATAFTNKDTTGTSKDPLLGMMGILAFSDRAKADTAKSDCDKSEIKSFKMFGSMALTATIIGAAGTGDVLTKILNGQTPTQGDMEAAMNSFSGTDEEKAAIGAAAVSASSSYCNEDNKTSPICVTLSEAVAGGSSDLAIGAALIQALDTN